MSENGATSRPAPQDFVVDHPAWRAALGEVRAALSRPFAVVALLGPAGTGKTLLLRTLLDGLRSEGRPAALLERGDAEDRPAARAGVVLVDEADRVGPAMLEALAGSGAGGVVLAALPGFAERVASLPGASVVLLRPLEAEEAASFVRARAKATGAPDRLASDAVTEIVANGKGTPRLLDALLTAAEFVASLQSAPQVTAEHVQEAVLLRGEMGAEAAEEPPPALPPAEAGDGSVRSPDPDERWAESGGATAAPMLARRRTGIKALLACAALAALFGAYAMVQPAGGGLGLKLAATLPPVGAAPAPPPAIPAAELAPSPAAAVVPTPAASQASDAAPGPARAGLPMGVAPHVVLTYQQGDAAAERRSIEAAHALRAAGFAASDPVPVPGRIRGSGIAYFFADDQAGAAEIGQALGGAFGEGRAAALRLDEPLPRPGTVEVQVSSDRPVARQAE